MVELARANKELLEEKIESNEEKAILREEIVLLKAKAYKNE